MLDRDRPARFGKLASRDQTIPAVISSPAENEKSRARRKPHCFLGKGRPCALHQGCNRYPPSDRRFLECSNLPRRQRGEARERHWLEPLRSLAIGLHSAPPGL